MAQGYFVKRGKTVKGPFSLKKLQHLSETKKLKDNDLISTSDHGPWKAPAQCEALQISQPHNFQIQKPHPVNKVRAVRLDTYASITAFIGLIVLASGLRAPIGSEGWGYAYTSTGVAAICVATSLISLGLLVIAGRSAPPGLSLKRRLFEVSKVAMVIFPVFLAVGMFVAMFGEVTRLSSGSGKSREELDRESRIYEIETGVRRALDLD